jgi:hypothetical protein
VPIEHPKWENGNSTILCIAFLVLSTIQMGLILGAIQTTISYFTLALPFFEQTAVPFSHVQRGCTMGCEAQKRSNSFIFFPYSFSAACDLPWHFAHCHWSIP